MRTTTEFWRNYWNNLAKRNSPDHELDRGTSLRVDKLEQRAAQQFFEAVDPKPTDLVLDAGCGTGVNICKIGGLVAGIVGIDFSQEMIKRVGRRIATQRTPNVTLLVGDVTQMEFPSSTFDKIICTSVLQYLNTDECKAALQEMVRVCKNGGTIVIHAKNRTSLYGLSLVSLKFIAGFVGRKTTPDYYRPRVWYEHAISRCGGRIVDYDSFGIFTFLPLPKVVVHHLLQLEMMLVKGKWLKKYGVNYAMTIRVEKEDLEKSASQVS